MSTPFGSIAETLEQAARTRGRNERARLIGELLRRLEPDEVRPAVHLMLGRGAGVKSGVSWASLFAAARATFGELDEPIESEGYVDAGDIMRQMAARVEPAPQAGGVGMKSTAAIEGPMADGCYALPEEPGFGSG